LPFEPGKSGNPNGRPKGAISEKTALGREAIKLFVDNNAPRLAGWLDSIAAKDPVEAFKCYMSVVEYAIPRLQRSEVTGKDGKDLIPQLDDRTALERFAALMSLAQQPKPEPIALTSSSVIDAEVTIVSEPTVSEANLKGQ